MIDRPPGSAGAISAAATETRARQVSPAVG